MVLRQFGEYFFKFCKSSGYDHMLRTLGGNLCEFTENLDALHSFLSLSYKVRVSVLFLWIHSLNSLCSGAGNERTVLPGGEGP